MGIIVFIGTAKWARSERSDLEALGQTLKPPSSP